MCINQCCACKWWSQTNNIIIYILKIWNIPKLFLMQIIRVSSLIQAQFKTSRMVIVLNECFWTFYCWQNYLKFLHVKEKKCTTQYYVIISSISKFNVESDQNLVDLLIVVHFEWVPLLHLDPNNIIII
jgi:hypothetical protein